MPKPVKPREIRRNSEKEHPAKKEILSLATRRSEKEGKEDHALTALAHLLSLRFPCLAAGGGQGPCVECGCTQCRVGVRGPHLPIESDPRPSGRLSQGLHGKVLAQCLCGPNWGLFCPEIRAFMGFWGEISSTVFRVLSDHKVRFKHKNGC